MNDRCNACALLLILIITIYKKLRILQLSKLQLNRMNYAQSKTQTDLKFNLLERLDYNLLLVLGTLNRLCS